MAASRLVSRADFLKFTKAARPQSDDVFLFHPGDLFPYAIWMPRDEVDATIEVLEQAGDRRAAAALREARDHFDLERAPKAPKATRRPTRQRRAA